MIKFDKDVKFDNDMFIIVQDNMLLYLKKKYVNKNYNFITLNNYLIKNYTGNKKIVNNNEDYLIMLESLKKCSNSFSRYKDFISYDFAKELLKTYNNFYDYKLVNNDKVNDLKIVFEEYEKILDKNNLINDRLIKLYMLNNYDFNDNYTILGLENLSDVDNKIINKMKNKIVVNTVVEQVDNKYYYNEFNDVEDEISFVLNDIKKRVIENNYSYKDFIIVSKDIDIYAPYFDLFFDIPYTNKVSSGVLVAKFINIFKNILNGDFSCKTFISLLKLGVYQIDEEIVNKLDNYVYSWNLENKSFIDEFTYNPNRNDAKMTSSDTYLLNLLNREKEKIIIPLFHLIKNTVNNKNKIENLKELYTYLSEEKIIDYLYENDYDGASNLINTLESINDYLSNDSSLIDIVNVLSNLTLIKNKKNILNNAISISNLENAFYDDKKFVYFLGCSHDIIESSFKPSGLITYDDIEESNLIELINEYNEKNDYYINKVLSNKKVLISYHKLSTDLRLKNFADRLNKLELQSYDNDKLYDVNLLKKDYANKLSNHKIDIIKDDNLDKINNNYMHDLNKKIKESTSAKLYNNELLISPSSIESYAKCPFYYFMQYGIKLKVKEKYLFDNREAGTFVHYVLENIIRNDLNEITLDNIDLYVEKYSKNYLEDNNKICDNRTKYVIKRLSESTKNVVKSIIEEQQFSKYKPRFTELKIKPNETVKPFEISLDDKKVKITGVVDRLDSYEDENNYYYRIIDYKTGEKSFRLDEVINGINLQMLIYLLAIKENSNKITNKNIIPSGLLYFPALLKYDNGNRFSSDEEKEKLVKKRLRMNGILNKNMIEGIDEETIKDFYSIFSYNKVSDEYIFDEEKINLIFNNLRSTITSIANDIFNGNIKVDPIGGDVDSCKYCNFSSICSFDNKNDKKRKIEKLKNTEVIQKLEGDNNA